MLTNAKALDHTTGDPTKTLSSKHDFDLNIILSVFRLLHESISIA